LDHAPSDTAFYQNSGEFHAEPHALKNASEVPKVLSTVEGLPAVSP